MGRGASIEFIARSGHGDRPGDLEPWSCGRKEAVYAASDFGAHKKTRTAGTSARCDCRHANARVWQLRGIAISSLFKRTTWRWLCIHETRGFLITSMTGILVLIAAYLIGGIPFGY